MCLKYIGDINLEDDTIIVADPYSNEDKWLESKIHRMRPGKYLCYGEGIVTVQPKCLANNPDSLRASAAAMMIFHKSQKMNAIKKLIDKTETKYNQYEINRDTWINVSLAQVGFFSNCLLKRRDYFYDCCCDISSSYCRIIDGKGFVANLDNVMGKYLLTIVKDIRSKEIVAMNIQIVSPKTLKLFSRVKNMCLMLEDK